MAGGIHVGTRNQTFPFARIKWSGSRDYINMRRGTKFAGKGGGGGLILTCGNDNVSYYTTAMI